MTSLPTKITKPRNKADIDYSLLKSELSDLIAERDQLVCVVILNIEAEYQLKIGWLEYDKFKMQVAVSRMRRAIELAQTAINRDEQFFIAEIEETLNQEFLEWEQKLRKHLKQIKAAQNRFKSLLSSEESEESAKIYKKIVKMLHPDVNLEMYEKNRDLWERAAMAYKNGDLEGLRVLLILLEDVGEEPKIDSDFLKRRSETLKSLIKKVMAEIRVIKSKFPYILKDKLGNETWVKNEQEKLKSEISELRIYRDRMEEAFDKMRKSCPI
jgi:hypothetical protein